MTRKKTLGIIAVLLWVVFASCAATCGVLYYQVSNTPNVYTEVAVRISDITYEPDALSYGTHAVVTVSYEGRDRELISVVDGEVPKYEAGYQANQPVTVYLSDGKLYSNVNGIKSHNIKGRMSGMMLGISAAAFMAAVAVTGAYAGVLKKERAGEGSGKDA